MAWGLSLLSSSTFVSLSNLNYSALILPDSINVFGLSKITYNEYKSHNYYNISFTDGLAFEIYS